MTWLKQFKQSGKNLYKLHLTKNLLKNHPITIQAIRQDLTQTPSNKKS